MKDWRPLFHAWPIADDIDGEVDANVTVSLNGAVTVHMRDGELASGPIALQYGAGVVKFRKVQIKAL